METTITSTAGLIPVSLSLVGLMAALQYLKGMTDYAAAVRLVFFGFLFLFAAKVLALATSVMPTEYYYAVKLTLCLWSAVFLAAGGLKIKGVKLFNFTVMLSSCLLAAVWSWYVVIVMHDADTLTLSFALSTAGYGVLAASLWRRKALRNSIGFVITGWFCVFLLLYKLLGLMSWGQNLMSPSFETFLFIAIMCGFILISNNLMAHQFDTLEQAAEESKERLRLMIQMSPFPIIISRLKDDQLMLINNKAGALFGLDVKHPGRFKTVDYFADPSKRTELLAKLEKNPVVDDFEFLVKPRKGNPFWLLLSARVIDFEYEIALYMAFQDITDRKKKEMQLFDQATRDPLTKCYNRRQFEELAKKEVQRSRRYNHPFCLFMIDADHFKNVNDTHGHAVGDLVLQALADCCRRTLRESDIIARFGGEEFVILLPEATIENGFRVAERLRIKISKLVVKNEQDEDVRFTVSIGLVSSTVTDDIAEMLKMSDESLYVAKENGRNQVVVYESDGPNKDLPKPDGEDIEKIKNEPPYYFTPDKAIPVDRQGADAQPLPAEPAPPVSSPAPVPPPVVEDGREEESYDEEYAEYAEDEAPEIPDAPQEYEQEYETAYDGDEQNDFASEEQEEQDFSPIPEISPDGEGETAVSDYNEDEYADLTADSLPPVADTPEEDFDFELPPSDVAEDESSDPTISEQDNTDAPEPELPPEEDEFRTEETPPAYEPPVSVSDYNEPELPPDDDELPPEQDDFAPPPGVTPLSFAQEEDSAETEALSTTSEPPPVPLAVKMPPKAPVMRKIPIKMPVGMVKVPAKMPGVVRVKIPKALHADAPIIKPPQE